MKFQIKQMHPISSKTLLSIQPRYYNYTRIEILPNCIDGLVFFVGDNDELNLLNKELEKISDIPKIKRLQGCTKTDMDILSYKHNKIIYVIHTDRLSEYFE